MEDEKYTVLVVDDEQSLLSFMALLLKEAGINCVTAASGYAAFGVIESLMKASGHRGVDLVITDWRMKGWDGVRLLTEIRARPYGKIPIILMSGAVTKEQLEMAAQKKADGILVKPIVKETLLAKVAAFRAAARPKSGV